MNHLIHSDSWWINYFWGVDYSSKQGSSSNFKIQYHAIKKKKLSSLKLKFFEKYCIGRDVLGLNNFYFPNLPR